MQTSKEILIQARNETTDHSMLHPHGTLQTTFSNTLHEEWGELLELILEFWAASALCYMLLTIRWLMQKRMEKASYRH